ncbi:MAG: ribose-phosphate diphosphokinase [archaeon]
MHSGKYSIIADPNSPNWNFADKIFKILSEKSSDFEMNKIDIKRFRDGEIKTKIELNIRGKCCFFIHDSSKSPAEWFLELALINQAMAKSSANEIIDVIPYLKFSRQDRKDESRVAINAQVVANLIDKHAGAVLTLDVHNPSIDGFYQKRFDNLYSFKTLIDYLKLKHPEIISNLVVMSPDAGGTERANAFARRLGITEIAIGYKRRKVAGEVDSLRIIGDVKGKNVFLIDDIVDSGNTLIKACQAAKEQGAEKVYAYCTHGLFTEGIDRIAENLDLFFVGDTLAQKSHPKLEIVSFAPLFAEAIYRISKGESLSELFK